MTTISVFGLGRVGLSTAVCFANKGYRVIGIDTNENVVEQIRKRRPPFFEPQLDEYLKAAIDRETFLATCDPSLSQESDLILIAVGTATRDGKTDLSGVENAAATIGRSLSQTEHRQVIVIKSTVPPGTARKVVKPTVEREFNRTADKQFGLCSNPEFLREGNALHEVEFPDRIIIGSDDPEAAETLERFYREFHGGKLPPIIRTTHENAELIKYANNAFLATKVSFINCVANVAERFPFTDVKTVAAGIGVDARIGSEFLNAGLGWGGSCLPKDLDAMIEFSRASGYNPQLLEAVAEINRKQWQKATQAARDALGELAGKRVAILGFSFKPQTDDFRGAASIPIINDLLSEGADVVLYDPASMDNARKVFQDRVSYARSAYDCVEGAECCIVVTEWDEFRTIPPSAFVERMAQPIVIDGRRIYEPDEFMHAGVRLWAIGLGPRNE